MLKLAMLATMCVASLPLMFVLILWSLLYWDAKYIKNFVEYFSNQFD